MHCEGKDSAGTERTRLFLNKNHLCARTQFAIEMLNKYRYVDIIEQSDEIKIELFGSNSNHMAWRISDSA